MNQKNNPFQQIPCDNFIDFLNDPPNCQNQMEEDNNAEKLWMFEDFNGGGLESNPFYEELSKPKLNQVQPQRSKAQFGSELLQNLKKNKEENILKKNKDLFQANQSKSIYLTKISQLVETPKPSTKPKTYQISQLNRRTKVIVESDSSDYGNGKSKLAKNRESARNSRKRKKIYIELLENKVQELTQEIEELQNSNREIQNHNTNLEQLMFEYKQSITQLNTAQQLVTLQEQFGAGSQRRWTVCTQIINSLIDATIPYEIKRLIESAQKGIDFFTESLFKFNQQTQDLKNRFVQFSIQLETANQMLGVQYDNVRSIVFNLEKLKWELLQTINPQTYIEYLNFQ